MLKPIDIETSIQVVWPRDPAIDQEASDIEGYQDNASSGRWKDYLKIKEGAKPTIFKVGVIPSPELISIEETAKKDGGIDFQGLCWRSFLHSVRDIENAGELCPETMDKSGRKNREFPYVTIGDVKYIAPTFLSRTFIKSLRGCGVFIGSVAYSWNLLSEEDGKNL